MSVQMIKKASLAFAATAALVLTATVASAAGGGGPALKTQKWSFDGPMGSYDRAQVQRGYQVYSEVCAGCHSLKYVRFGNLLDIGFSEAQAKAIAAEFEAEDGPDDDGEIFSLLTGYSDAPEGHEVAEGMNYNAWFPGTQIAMAPPVSDEGVEYVDGTAATVDQQSKDVSAFLMWAAEPKLEDRHRTGLKTMIFLIILTGLFWLVKRRVWADAH